MIYDQSGTKRLCDVCGGNGYFYEPIRCLTCNGTGLVAALKGHPAAPTYIDDGAGGVAELFDNPEDV